ncbi:hypothetical protein AABM38_06790 [Heyndrickxia sp. MSNUG]|uniref:hypothetical protein n=1 Tax=Heyndrickxia sp. MSNUG TaxID=3136677 RepID=UPI003C2C0371
MGDERTRDAFDFMLGENGKNLRDQSVDAENEPDSDFRHFMFGNSTGEETKARDSQSTESGLLSQIDLGEVLYHVDTLITSAKELKPLFGKVRPFFDHLIDKNKS